MGDKIKTKGMALGPGVNCITCDSRVITDADE